MTNIKPKATVDFEQLPCCCFKRFIKNALINNIKYNIIYLDFKNKWKTARNAGCPISLALDYVAYAAID
jgi:hypothetical protein